MAVMFLLLLVLVASAAYIDYGPYNENKQTQIEFIVFAGLIVIILLTLLFVNISIGYY